MSEVEKLVERLKTLRFTISNIASAAGVDHKRLSGCYEEVDQAADRLQSQSRRVEEREGALRKIIATIRAMDDEYNLDNECDYTKINEFIEVLADLADLSEGSGSSRELAPPDESGDACGATERAEG